jgi:hypothetical protein
VDPVASPPSSPTYYRKSPTTSSQKGERFNNDDKNMTSGTPAHPGAKGLLFTVPISPFNILRNQDKQRKEGILVNMSEVLVSEKKEAREKRRAQKNSANKKRINEHLNEIFPEY